ncbi:MAG: tRNA uridine-5-carboxymethylaminomethyl(34) synthesis GTPase MnmE, partial [Candidatus Krumholzibacteria bacterium]|nr:tRNA uridine-5-carboxymethylaminomethyl(34) synthesis GTPase MnmE [Candidatus Krumholzibacteria bacterium]
LSRFLDYAEGGAGFGAALFARCVLTNFDAQSETVVALATPSGEGGLAVVRVCGPEAFAVAAAVFEAEGFGPKPEPRRAVYGILKWPSGELSSSSKAGCPIDQALALPFRGPHSYTGEDTVEFFCHGGRMVARSVVSACRMAGAVPAAAGEFTRRAFLNGKLSLGQAEAVADLIHAQSEHSARAAVRQLLGGLDVQLREIEKPLLDLLAHIEGSLEFVDEEEIVVPRDEILQVLSAGVERLDRLVDMAPAGRLLRDGVHVVLAGAPNVGKSSLFNALLEDDRAIVDGEAGTTRDVVSGRLHRAGSVFVLHDTAGLREDPGRVEEMGIARTWRQVAEADIVLALNVAGEEATVISPGGGAPVVSVFTKSDLVPDFVAPAGALLVSSNSGEGLAGLWVAIDAVVAGFQLEEAISLGVVLNERHLHKLSACRGDLERLRHEVDLNAPGDEVVGSLLSSILSGLGEVSGRVFTEHLLENIFQRFCVGK